MVSVAWTFNSSILTFSFFKFSELFFGFTNLKFLPSAATKNASAPPLHTNIAGAKDWMDDFALSVNEASSSAIGYLLFTLWILGIIIMIILAIRSALFLHSLKNLHHLLKIRMFKNYIDAA